MNLISLTLTLTLITPTIVEISCISILDMVCKNNLMLVRHQRLNFYTYLEKYTFITITLVPIFVLWNFEVKVCNTDWIMPSFCDFFHPFYSVV